ncbi:MAG: hypothetical protein FD153_1535, partial [Rhodospirillaceae bacterium]
QDQKAITRLLEHDVGLLRALSEIQAQGNLVAGLLVSAGNRVSCPVAGTVHRRARFDRAASDHNSGDNPKGPPCTRPLLKLVDRVPGNIFDLRHEELEMGQQAEALVVSSLDLSRCIDEHAERLVATAHATIDALAASTRADIGRGRGVLLAVAGATILLVSGRPQRRRASQGAGGGDPSGGRRQSSRERTARWQ